MLNVCLAGATGWAGSELARSMARTADLALVAAVARKHAGRILGEVLGEPRLTGHIYASAAEALAIPCDVFVEYTKPDSAKTNILTALEHSARPYADGALLAIRQVSTLVGVHRGLDCVLDL